MNAKIFVSINVMTTLVINVNIVQDKPAELSIKNSPEIKIYKMKCLADQVGCSGESGWFAREF